MDKNARLRESPLMAVLAHFGHTEWKKRSAKPEHYGRCPLHEAKTNTASFSFNDSGVYHCFSCNAKGRGAIDLVMAAVGQFHDRLRAPFAAHGFWRTPA